MVSTPQINLRKDGRTIELIQQIIESWNGKSIFNSKSLTGSSVGLRPCLQRRRSQVRVSRGDTGEFPSLLGRLTRPVLRGPKGIMGMRKRTDHPLVIKKKKKKKKKKKFNSNLVDCPTINTHPPRSILLWY